MMRSNRAVDYELDQSYPGFRVHTRSKKWLTILVSPSYRRTELQRIQVEQKNPVRLYSNAVYLYDEVQFGRIAVHSEKNESIMARPMPLRIHPQPTRAPPLPVVLLSHPSPTAPLQWPAAGGLRA
jgi:hypothetical protein